MAASGSNGGIPIVRRMRPLRVGLMVEPTPFTHVSGYANRFNEMLKNLRKAGDEVEVVTPDNEEHGAAPSEVHGHRVNNLRGFKYPMYPLITLTLDLKGRALGIMNRFRPDILHVATPSFLCFCGILASRVLSIPLVLSYHTHLPVYARNYGNTSSLWRFMGPDFNEWLSWKVIRVAHSNADLTLVTSPQMKEELELNGVERVAVWRKGIDVRYISFYAHLHFFSASLLTRAHCTARFFCSFTHSLPFTCVPASTPPKKNTPKIDTPPQLHSPPRTQSTPRRRGSIPSSRTRRRASG